MGRHTKLGQPDDEPAPDARAPAGPFFSAPPGPSYDAFSGPTDDQVFVSRYEAVSRYETEDHIPDARLWQEPSAEPAALQDPPSGNRAARLLALVPVPLLPIVALVVAVGVVAYALSTQQISLNFAGGAPKEPANAPRDSQVSQRGPGQRASRGAGRPDGVVIAFRVVSRTPRAFRATATITNQGQAAVPQWALAFKIQAVSVRAVSGASVVRTGALAFVRGRTQIAPGQSVRIVFTATGTPRKPNYCILNRLACTLV
ncbi:cellulose binding domain-containing protein [Actinomadura graeca]|uniref:Cellulose binding domain-containing protein n=1 Tax=Actinomadura graeca TaxID=2750812 RepID=A0ABX8R1T6_9ACTN|nr:cellulose binding domain-containing protein [Actinomadura graeca]QXJ24853.1 cellulose binding domain-containing protein [Actinomadura graeca]